MNIVRRYIKEHTKKNGNKTYTAHVEVKGWWIYKRTFDVTGGQGVMGYIEPELYERSNSRYNTFKGKHYSSEEEAQKFLDLAIKNQLEEEGEQEISSKIIKEMIH